MAWKESCSNNRKIPRVAPLLRGLEKKGSDDYSPLVVSLGPYHHGKPELAFLEAFKPTAVEMFFSGGLENRDFYYNEVLINIKFCDIKSCYEHESIAKYSDEELAEMMLCDASLVIMFMQTIAWTTSMEKMKDSMKKMKAHERDEEEEEKYKYMCVHLGTSIFLNLARDIYVLENQIPLFLIKRLVSLRYGEGKDDELLSRFFGDFPQESFRELENREPLHLLEAFHRLLFSSSKDREKTNTFQSRWLRCSGADKETDLETGGIISKCNNSCFSSVLASVGKLLARRKNVAGVDIHDYVPSFRSATDLKAKGIYFKACASRRSLRQVSFRTHLFYSRLQLPRVIVSTKTKVQWKNMIAYEVYPNSRAENQYLLSYISFMKSLIQTPEDVKELRESKVICSLLDSDDEVLDMFRDIKAHFFGALLFREVHDQIQAHCSSTAKNWMAELVHANFQSPWKLIAFIAAVALLGISAGQLYYAVHPN